MGTAGTRIASRGICRPAPPPFSIPESESRKLMLGATHIAPSRTHTSFRQGLSNKAGCQTSEHASQNPQLPPVNGQQVCFMPGSRTRDEDLVAASLPHVPISIAKTCHDTTAACTATPSKPTSGGQLARASRRSAGGARRARRARARAQSGAPASQRPHTTARQSKEALPGSRGQWRRDARPLRSLWRQRSPGPAPVLEATPAQDSRPAIVASDCCGTTLKSDRPANTPASPAWVRLRLRCEYSSIFIF